MVEMGIRMCFLRSFLDTTKRIAEILLCSIWGLRQDDPLLPFLFTLVADSLYHVCVTYHNDHLFSIAVSFLPLKKIVGNGKP